MNQDDFRAFVAAHEWTFAKSMPHIPHFYVVRKHCRADSEFVQAVRLIRAAGEARPWGRGRPLTYFDIDGWTYWTMGSPLSETTIINRKITGTSMGPPTTAQKGL